MEYSLRSNGKEHGSVYTKPEIVDLIFQLIGYKENVDLRSVRLLDPSAGEGNFILDAVQILINSSRTFNFDFIAAYKNLHAVEIDHDKVTTLKNNLLALLERNHISPPDPYIIIHEGDFLEYKCPTVDIIVGNPPYVRYDNIPENKKELYRYLYSTFRNRSDIYIPFIEHSIKNLSQGGQLCFICADRWLKNQYGQSLRKLIINSFHLKLYIALNNISPFEETVMAYPSIFIITNGGSGRTKYFIAEDQDSLKIENIENTNDFLDFSETGQLMLRSVSTKHTLLEEQDYTIGIGVATGADKVFINKNFENLVEPEILLPLITTKEIYKGKILWKGTKIINPFIGDSKDLVDLDDYPMLKDYLMDYSSLLMRRHVARKNPHAWYKTIDRIIPSLRTKPKILLPDITTQRYIYFDNG